MIEGIKDIIFLKCGDPEMNGVRKSAPPPPPPPLGSGIEADTRFINDDKVVILTVKLQLYYITYLFRFLTGE